MNAIHIKGATRVIGESQGYIGLPLRDVLVNCTVGGDATPAMESAWLPTEAELSLLNQGKPITLTVLGTAHPPVMLEVQP